MNSLTSILPVSLLGPIVLLIGILLIGVGQNRSINSIQKALVPQKDTFLVDALRVKSKLSRSKYSRYWRRYWFVYTFKRIKKL